MGTARWQQKTQHCLFQGPTKYIQIVIFGLKVCIPSGNPGLKLATEGPAIHFSVLCHHGTHAEKGSRRRTQKHQT
jgi:hypothetical protein